ncbi:MAG: hypothetical protein IKR48_05265 [Kiritimatiellae bacterium]|nr:hypothetical protein [Kiritimatiellia bacterium]
MSNVTIVVEADNRCISNLGGRLSPAAGNAAREDMRPLRKFTPINNVRHNNTYQLAPPSRLSRRFPALLDFSRFFLQNKFFCYENNR